MRTLLPCAIGIGLALAACGDDSGSRVRNDAAVGTDGAIAVDAANGVDAAPSPVTITITHDGSATSGVVVYFLNADSSLVAEKMTDGTGTASQFMVAGGSVTALVTYTPMVPMVGGAFQNVHIKTFSGVKPGDHLVLASDDGNTAQNAVVTAPLDDAADTYELFTTCDETPNSGGLDQGSGVATGTITLAGGCTTADMTLWAEGSGQLVGVATALAVSITGNIDLTAAGVLGAFVTPTSVTLDYTNTPATGPLQTSGITGIQALLTTHGELLSPASATGFAEVDTDTHTATTSVFEPTITASKALTLTDPQYGGAQYGNQTIAEVSAPAATYTLDVGANLLRPYTSTPVFAQPIKKVSWNEDATAGEVADFSVTMLDIDRDDGSDNNWDWEMSAPRTATSVTFPTLPVDVYDYNAGSGDSVDIEELSTYKVPGGFDAVRAFSLNDLAPAAAIGLAGTGRGTVETLPMLVTVRHGHRAAHASQWRMTTTHAAPRARKVGAPSTSLWHRVFATR